MLDIEKYKVDVPEGRQGDWYVKQFTVSKKDAVRDLYRAAFNFSSCLRCVPAGTYTKLVHSQRGVIMSDTPDEINDHREVIRRANGLCLVNGLGLGVVINGMLMNPEVERVDCVEQSDEVIALVGQHWVDRYGGRFRIIQADAMEYRPPRGVRYNVVWHDIWDTICYDNLEEMKRLHRVYGRRCDWQGSWARRLCELNR